MNNFSRAVATRANAGPYKWLSHLAVIAGLMMPYAAQAEVAQCLMRIDGQTYVNGLCTVRKDGEIISFGEGRDDKYSAHVSAKGLSFWNNGGTRVNVPIGELTQSGACWNNERAKICFAPSTEEAKSFAEAPTGAVVTGSFPIASCKGPNGTLLSTSGTDTANATIVGEIKQDDLDGWCARMSATSPEAQRRCQSEMQHLSRSPLRAQANCSAHIITSTRSGAIDRVRLVVKKVDKVEALGKQIEVPDVGYYSLRDRKEYGSACAYGMGPIADQFAIMCPNTWKSMIAAAKSPVLKSVIPADSTPTAASVPGTNSNSVADWHALLSTQLERGKRYPREARARKETGVATLSFTVDRQGNVGNVSITKSSGSAILDKETLLLAVRLSPLPAPPAEVTGTLIPISVPVRYGSAEADATTKSVGAPKIEDMPTDVYCLIRVGKKIYVDGRCARRRIEQDVISVADSEKKQFMVHILNGGTASFWNAGNRNVSVALGALEERGPCQANEAVTVCVFNSTDALTKFSSRYRSVFSGPAEKYLTVGFQSPSKNIHCQYYYAGTSDRIVTGIRCDMKVSLDAAPPKPSDCDGNWSNKAFWISNAVDVGSRVCPTDSVLDERLPVLEYGRTWKQKGIECKSDAEGISCVNDRKHGFKITKSSKALF